MPAPHQCPIKGCDTLIQQNQFACRIHRNHASEEKKRSIEGAWRQIGNARTDEQRVEAARLHNFAVQEAIHQINVNLKRGK